jgi:hypothetical protein
MAYLNYQWLKGEAERQRKHNLEEVTLGLVTGTWCAYENVRAVIGMTRKDGDYQFLRLTDKDLTELLPELLASLDNSQFLSCLENALVNRRRANEG